MILTLRLVRITSYKAVISVDAALGRDPLVHCRLPEPWRDIDQGHGAVAPKRFLIAAVCEITDAVANVQSQGFKNMNASSDVIISGHSLGGESAMRCYSEPAAHMTQIA